MNSHRFKRFTGFLFFVNTISSKLRGAFLFLCAAPPPVEPVEPIEPVEPVEPVEPAPPLSQTIKGWHAPVANPEP